MVTVNNTLNQLSKKIIKLAITVLVCLVVTACTIPHAVKPITDSSSTNQLYPIFVVNNGWHTGLIIPAPLSLTSESVMKSIRSHTQQCG